MKWNKLIENQTNSQERRRSPIERFNTSRSRLLPSQPNADNLTFKSCEKLRNNAPLSLVQKITSTPDQNPNELSNKKSNSRQSNSARTEIEKLNRAYSTLERSHNGIFHELEEVAKIIDSFSAELESLVKNCVARFEQTVQSRETKDEFIRRLSQSIDETASRCLVNSEPILMRAHTDFTLGSHNKHSAVEIKSPEFPSDKKKNRVMRFKEDKVNEKNCFHRLQKGIEEAHTLLRDGKEPKFIRTSRLSKKDRSNDSSVEEMMEKSMYQSQRTNRSKQKAKDTLYNINKILNQ